VLTRGKLTHRICGSLRDEAATLRKCVCWMRVGDDMCAVAMTGKVFWTACLILGTIVWGFFSLLNRDFVQIEVKLDAIRSEKL
jgi:hypothetical protein